MTSPTLNSDYFLLEVQVTMSLHPHYFSLETDHYLIPQAWMRSPRMHGGVGHIGMPLLADTNHAIAKVKILLLLS